MLGAAALEQIPETTLPEIAFAGRSNVGKSSLINALTGRRTLARTSNTPGRTQQVNFFNLGGRMIIADLPGYGFARAPKQDVEKWQRLVDAYLKGRAPLRRVCLLVDSRHGLKEVDHTVMKMLDTAAVSYQVVLTKADKIGEQALETLCARVKREMAPHVAAHPVIAVTSSAKGTGIAELRAALGTLAQDGKTG
ncbi:MAG: ribosome biogenesis GTP-binding protein YihA/YsxC [Rhodospirillales bacterium]|nr:ribosome biogenesis GTP-binding protein YihA/YsxC [Rhodospirillales bacterium]MCW8862857.1 ribosome biogenesis GTP-binding protein YihA/YsxC [Rhodospirillales bacterium]MCW8952733.1 ribosome biogenesis GTP-binding protein YihA/YsxC [Rhodospirillales bacterium]MCW8970133.1 ribosome biogenesis GTP-binding protein YihA/YsxC [Rhodospirillales bacterium]MCW9002680.1 ribosome biogenesis GTP-binding protein YihA/YsxC [Rhodospirillales bacterium]